MRRIFLISMFVAILSPFVSCAPAGTKPGQRQENKTGEIPVPESKGGCMMFAGRFVSAEPNRFNSIVFLQTNDRLAINIVKGNSSYDLVTGKDPVELDDGTTLVASCNGGILSIGILSSDLSLYLKFKQATESEIEVRQFNDEGKEVGNWLAIKPSHP